MILLASSFLTVAESLLSAKSRGVKEEEIGREGREPVPSQAQQQQGRTTAEHEAS